MDYYIYKNNQNVGPLGESEVINGIRSRRFLTSDLGCRVGESAWKDLSFFFPLETSPPAPQPAQRYYQQPPSVTDPVYQQPPRGQTQPLYQQQRLPPGFNNPPQQMQQMHNAPVTGNPYQYGDYQLGARFVALLIDGLIGTPLVFLAAIPFVGIIGAPLACLYFISRDAIMGNGQSVGKRVMNLRVIKSDGQPFTWADSVKRNIIYFPLLLLMVPWVGHILHSVIAGPVGIVELILVISGGQRIGDRMGNTYVVRA